MTSPDWYIGHVPGPCPYLDGQDWRLMLVDGNLLGPSYRRLLDEGFRRHGEHLYRPDCPGCNACQVHRVPLEDFQMTRSQRRVWRKGGEVFELVEAAPVCTDEKVAMYNAYLAHQHGTKEEPVDAARYHDFFVASCLPGCTLELQVRTRDEGRLVAVGIADVVEDALSTVYCYFDPAYADHSPGTFSALAEIHWARERGLRYYYMGFYIASCGAMAYKARFGPCEVRTLDEQSWTPIAQPDRVE